MASRAEPQQEGVLLTAAPCARVQRSNIKEYRRQIKTKPGSRSGRICFSTLEDNNDPCSLHTEAGSRTGDQVSHLGIENK